MDPPSLGLGRNGKLGIACTGAALLEDWVSAHPAPKLVLHRPIDQVNASLARIGVPVMEPDFAQTFIERLKAIDGMHIYWHEIFVPGTARKVWKFLKLPGDFNDARHAEMATWSVEPDHDKVIVELDATRDFMRRIKAAL